MNRVRIFLENCYGIKEIRADLDFAATPAYAVYAPNGVMKSSLALTFKDAANGRTSGDRIFTARAPRRDIKDELGNDIAGDRILVVGPYDEQFGPTEKTATLLVDATLKKEYDDLNVAIDRAKTALLTAVKRQAQSRRDFEAEVSSAFTPSQAKFQEALGRIRAEVARQPDAPLATVPYDLIFNDQVEDALSDTTVRGALADYIQRYNQLLDASVFFKKGKFDYYNAGQIAEQLAKNGFFEANHTVTLKGKAKTLEISSQQELVKVIADEKAELLADKELRQRFDAVGRRLEKNAAVRDLYRYLQANESLLPRLWNPKELKEDIIKSYLKKCETLFIDLMKQYDDAEVRISQIQAEARKQRTEWEEAIETFNARFFVPFRLEVRNRTEVMVGADQLMDLEFTYADGQDTATVDKTKLLQVLSTGERKAFYILNVLFEVARRKKAAIETLLIVDDIADSFDYQNKYAIVHYLKEISEDGMFKLVIMTHNFDLFRTLEGRFVGYRYCLMASKNGSGVSLAPAAGIRNIFANDWKGHFFDDPKKRIASVPFLRNLVEMTTGTADPNYTALTSMLHWKTDTAMLTVGSLDAIFNALCKTNGASPDQAKPVFRLIEEQAEVCLDEPMGMNLENKIVLSIATRLAAERVMIAKINDPAWVAAIGANQTQALIGRFKKSFPKEAEANRVFDLVALMTPENIHVNAFMYEPIVDMSDDHLRKLYRDVKALP